LFGRHQSALGFDTQRFFEQNIPYLIDTLRKRTTPAIAGCPYNSPDGDILERPLGR
jgi:hypothetical protein